MKKLIITIVFAFLLFGNAFGKVSWEAVQESMKILKKNLTETIDRLAIDPANKETLKKLEEILPTGPKGTWSGIEKDIFFPKIDKNKAAIGILEDKIKLFSEAIKELNKILKSQKSIQKKWNTFFKTKK